ncbi:gluconokinase [Geosmithia morbida]|uniref:Gluconokinase n=1 Tax=Geosmithia morbida TaxID=1094350 RepID=A0A9P4YVN4_9HYPO|nr:gluconokinase [Geosmithia morbida]KAF4123372.1 gluconokinase [Geosmithia morbida]
MLSYDAAMPTNKGHNMPSPPESLQDGLTNASPAKDMVLPPNTSHSSPHAYKHHHIWLVTGPAGCGKTTVASHLAKTLDLPYVEGDSYHPPANIEKMANGIPLTDADRWDWLTVLRDESISRIDAGADGVILTCSALKRKYRDVIRVASYYNPNLLIHFIYLDATEDLLLQRVGARQGHYMGANMVHSQMDTLERPSADERDVSKVDVSQSMEKVKQDALNYVVKAMAEDEAEIRQ